MAIKIIKPGKKPETLRFECPDCGCVFEADKDDYGLVTDASRHYRFAYTPCPSCGRTVRKSCDGKEGDDGRI